MRQGRSSRLRFRDYRRRIRQPVSEPHPLSPEVDPVSRFRSKHARTRTFAQLFVLFLGHLRGYRATIATALVLSGIGLGFGLIAPYLSKVAIDSAVDGHPYPDFIATAVPWTKSPWTMLSLLACTIIALQVFRVVIQTYSRWQATKVSQKMRVQLRRKMFQHALRLPLHRIYHYKSGGMASIIREDAGSVATLVFSMLYNPWGALVQIVGILVILGVSDWRMLAGALLLAPVMFFAHRLWIARIRPLWRDIRTTRSRIEAEVTETFSGIRVVRGFSRQRTESSNFASNIDFMARQEILSWWWSRAVDIIWQMLIPTALAGVLWYVGWRILQDREAIAAGKMTLEEALTVGDLFMFLWYLGSLLEPMAQLASTATQFQDALAGLDRTTDVLEEPTESHRISGKPTVVPSQVDGRIEFENVTFTYPGASEPAVREISLSAEPGQTVALVGRSGAGKSTVCNLVARFYEPDMGNILLDGQNTANYDVESYRRLLAIVEQDIFLFDGTVADNIRYGRRDASEEQVADAAQRAYAAEFIAELDNGYDTWIGERGVKLSGGQRQRLAIARALLADPRILILDEATSNLDTQSEQLIQRSLNELLASRTSFVIAHRLSTITHADQILVMDEGRIIEYGTHEQLIEQSGRYREMVHMQLQQPMQEVSRFRGEGGIQRDPQNAKPPESDETSARNANQPE